MMSTLRRVLGSKKRLLLQTNAGASKAEVGLKLEYVDIHKILVHADIF